MSDQELHALATARPSTDSGIAFLCRECLAQQPPNHEPRTMQDWQSSCHPDILKILAYWQSKRLGRTMPSREDIDPAELVAFLPYVMLVDVVDDDRRFVYRLVGTGEVEVRGNDPTGKSVAEGYFAASAEAALNNYETVCRTRAPFYEVDQFQVVDRYVGESNLFLPLSDDDKTVSMILVFSVNRDLYHRP